MIFTGAVPFGGGPLPLVAVVGAVAILSGTGDPCELAGMPQAVESEGFPIRRGTMAGCK